MADKTNEAVFDLIEWEALSTFKPLTIEVKPSERTPAGSRTVAVSRDSSYNVVGVLTGELLATDDEDRLRDKGSPGEPIPPFELHGVATDTLLDCDAVCLSKGGSHSSWNDNNQHVFSMQVAIHELVITGDLTAKPAWLSEWYLNGPRGRFLFDRITDRESKRVISRRREGLTESDPLRADEFDLDATMLSTDHTVVRSRDRQFLIGQVPHGLCPDWSVGIGIEYRPQWGGIPDQECRTRIAEIVGFVMGRPLIPVGWSEFDPEGVPLRSQVLSPWRSDFASLCQSGDVPPVQVSSRKMPRAGIFAKAVESLIDPYLEYRDQFSLGDALALFWAAKRMPIGANLPTFSAALETLMKGWFRCSSSKSKGVYMERKDFHELLGPEIWAQLAEKLGSSSVKYGKSMLGKMEGAYNMGANERFEVFFKELGLPTGVGERMALRERNAMAHGSINPERDAQLIQATRAYETLFHRVVLKLLGYPGDYIDYSVVGWPIRPIDEPIGY